MQNSLVFGGNCNAITIILSNLTTTYFTFTLVLGSLYTQKETSNTFKKYYKKAVVQILGNKGINAFLDKRGFE